MNVQCITCLNNSIDFFFYDSEPLERTRYRLFVEQLHQQYRVQMDQSEEKFIRHDEYIHDTTSQELLVPTTVLEYNNKLYSNNKTRGQDCDMMLMKLG